MWWVVLKENVQWAMRMWQSTEICLKPGFLLESRTIYLQMLQGGPMTWKVTPRNMRKDIANLRTKRLNNCTKSQRHAWMTINVKKKKMSENCTQFVHKLFWNVCISYYGLWINLPRLCFCRTPWRLKINIRRGLVYFRKSHVCANKLDVQETNFSFTQRHSNKHGSHAIRYNEFWF